MKSFYFGLITLILMFASCSIEETGNLPAEHSGNNDAVIAFDDVVYDSTNEILVFQNARLVVSDWNWFNNLYGIGVGFFLSEDDTIGDGDDIQCGEVSSFSSVNGDTGYFSQAQTSFSLIGKNIKPAVGYRAYAIVVTVPQSTDGAEKTQTNNVLVKSVKMILSRPLVTLKFRGFGPGMAIYEPVFLKGADDYIAWMSAGDSVHFQSWTQSQKSYITNSDIGLNGTYYFKTQAYMNGVSYDYFQTSFNPLSYFVAINQSNLSFVATGDGCWVLDSITPGAVGLSSLRIIDVLNYNSGSIETTVQSNFLSFYWKINAYSYSKMLLYIDGVLKDSISGATDWKLKQYALTSGSHAVKWVYSNDYYTSGQNSAWLDGLSGDYNAFMSSVNQALDTTGFVWSIAGDGGRERVTNTKQVGDSSLVIRDVGNDLSNVIETTFTGDFISFYCKMDVYDYSRMWLYIDGELKTEMRGSTEWQLKQYPLTQGMHTARWVYYNEYTDGLNCVWLDGLNFDSVAYYSSINQALDVSGFTWNIFGNGDLESVTDETQVGNSSLVFQNVIANQSNVIETTFTGDFLSFYWKIDAGYHGKMQLYIDGVLKGEISGTIDWKLKQYTLTSGTHTLRWVYRTSYVDGQNKAWLDGLGFDSAAYYSSINQALDVSGFNWNIYGYGSWFSESNDKQVGDSSLVLRDVSSYKSNVIETTFAGNYLSFYWKIDASYDSKMQLYLDGVLKDEINGTTAWKFKQCVLSSGTHTVKWLYQHNYDSSGQNSACLDGLSLDGEAFFSSINQALDVSGLNWNMSGDGLWGRVTNDKQVGDSSLVITNVGAYKSNVIETTFTGDYFSFYWKIDAYVDSKLQIYIDGVMKNEISDTTDWKFKQYVLTSGTHTVKWVYRNDYDYTGQNSAWLDGLSFDKNQYFAYLASLNIALDTTGLSFINSGDAEWTVDSATNYYGGSSLVSGDISDSQSVSLETGVIGSSVSFYWKVSSESGCDYLRFYIDDVLQQSISGTVDWTLKSYSLSAGSHTLKWIYSKDGSISSGSDCGWIDQLTVTP